MFFIKKVAIIASLNNFGGIEISLINLLNALPEKSIDVTIFLFEAQNELVKKIPSWINITMIKSQNFKEILANKENNTISCLIRIILRKVNKYIHKSTTMFQYLMLMDRYEKFNDEFDFAICWSLPNSIHTIYTLKNIKSKNKILWIHMDISHDEPPTDFNKYLKEYNKIYCVSQYCKMIFDSKFNKYSSKTEVFYNILESKNIAKMAHQYSLKKDSNLSIISCGRLSPEKQPLYAINIVNQLIKDGYNNFRWYFIGDGIMYDKMKKEINRFELSDHIILLGNKENPYPYIYNGDIFIQMSKHESFCLTLAESQILNVPAISTNFPSAYEIINDNITGYIVDNNWYKIYEKIKYLIEYPIIIDNLKVNLRNSEKKYGDVSKLLAYIYKIQESDDDEK